MSDNRIGRSKACTRGNFLEARHGFGATQAPSEEAAKVIAQARARRPSKPPQRTESFDPGYPVGR